MELAFDLIHNNGTAVIIGNDHHSSKITLNPFDFIKGKKNYMEVGEVSLKFMMKSLNFMKGCSKKNHIYLKKILNKEFDLKV